MIKLLAPVVLLLLPFLADAQSFYAIKRPRNLTVFAGTGTAQYKGELVNPKAIGQVRYNLVVGSELFLTSRITVRGELTWFRIAGSDKNANDDRVTRNLSFSSNCQELNLGAAFYFLPEQKAFFQRLSFNMYAFGGAGFLHFNPKAELDGKRHALQPLQTEGVDYSRFGFVIPTGIGVRFRLPNPLMNIQIEGAYRTTFTDRLDDISIRRYPDPTTLSSDLARKLSDRRAERIIEGGLDEPILPFNKGVRGNPKENDGYFLLNVKLQYYLPIEVFGKQSYNKAYRQKRKAFNPKRK